MVETHFFLMAAISMPMRVTKMNFLLPQCVSLLKHSTELHSVFSRHNWRRCHVPIDNCVVIDKYVAFLLIWSPNLRIFAASLHRSLRWLRPTLFVNTPINSSKSFSPQNILEASRCIWLFVPSRSRWRSNVGFNLWFQPSASCREHGYLTQFRQKAALFQGWNGSLLQELEPWQNLMWASKANIRRACSVSLRVVWESKSHQ